jgi:hypothetical protein
VVKPCRSVNNFFADAVFVYRVTGDRPVKLAALAAAKGMKMSQRAAAVRFVRSVAANSRLDKGVRAGGRCAANGRIVVATDCTARYR